MPSRQSVLQQSKNFTSRAAIHIASEELLDSDQERVDRSDTQREKTAPPSQAASENRRTLLTTKHSSTTTRHHRERSRLGLSEVDYEERQKQGPPVDPLLSHAEACGRQVGHFEHIVLFTVTHTGRPREGRLSTPEREQQQLLLCRIKVSGDTASNTPPMKVDLSAGSKLVPC